MTRSPSPRQSVHLHRDPALDSHAYRRGPWKLIVGHHLVPFIFTKVNNIIYITVTKVNNIMFVIHTVVFNFIFLNTKVNNETADQRVGFDGGSLRGLMLQLITDFLNLVIGEENALFFKWDVIRVRVTFVKPRLQGIFCGG